MRLLVVVVSPKACCAHWLFSTNRSRSFFVLQRSTISFLRFVAATTPGPAVMVTAWTISGGLRGSGFGGYTISSFAYFDGMEIPPRRSLIVEMAVAAAAAVVLITSFVVCSTIC